MDDGGSVMDLLECTPRFDGNEDGDQSSPHTPMSPNSERLPTPSSMDSPNKIVVTPKRRAYGHIVGKTYRLFEPATSTRNVETLRLTPTTVRKDYRCSLYFQPSTLKKMVFEETELSSEEEEEEPKENDEESSESLELGKKPIEKKQPSKKSKLHARSITAPSDQQLVQDGNYDVIYLVLIEGQDFKYCFHMVPPKHTRFIKLTGSAMVNKPNIVPRNCQAIENSLTETEYQDLLFFCSVNKNLRYNYLMDAYASSVKFQNIVSCLSGCCCSPKLNYVIVTQGEDSDLRDDEFKVPPHALVTSLTSCFNWLLNPPQTIPKTKKTSHKFTEDELATQRDSEEDDDKRERPVEDWLKDVSKKPPSIIPLPATQMAVVDLYSTSVVSRTVFTNSYQLHIFTYIAYLAKFIGKNDFLANCNLGYKSCLDFYTKVDENYKKDLADMLK